ncbi:streptogrisin D [Actinomadura pelletieri DSM 43383]|uniref:Streptogrisin D n=1 Tax=Actinomadura pelletieri DSM 43383 TaxID=1120940 RepID=A0A495QBX1_9ACTN|nr:S1 family peptidase [Actinomadura pelletieri]RKS69051.1 streptogrisin D [Actinomadura pelletieri DSM 43383]
MNIRPPRIHGITAAVATSVLLTPVLAAAAPASTVPGRGGADPGKIMAALTRDAGVPGTAWGVDSATGRVTVVLDSTVTGAKLKRVKAAVAEHGSAVRIEHVAGTLRPLTAGGESIYAAGGVRCTLGFNVKRGSDYFFLTAGHCAKGVTAWYADPELTKLLGTTSSFSFPGDDYGVVKSKYASTPDDLQGGVRVGDRYQDIVGAGRVPVGQTVTHVGQVSGVQTGRIRGYGFTVNYQQGAVHDLILTDICSKEGDSGGPLFLGDLAIGLASGGVGHCNSSGRATYFQPVDEVLQREGVTIY